MQLAEESEQQLATEREQFQSRLAELQASTAAAPPEQRKATVAAAQQHEAEVDIDEVPRDTLLMLSFRTRGGKPTRRLFVTPKVYDLLRPEHGNR